MPDEMIPVAIERLIPETTRLKNEGYRFVTLTCCRLPEEGWQIIYTFDRDYEMVHLSLNIPRGQEVPSLSPVYWAAFLVENEIQDLFGLRFQGADHRLSAHPLSGGSGSGTSFWPAAR